MLANFSARLQCFPAAGVLFCLLALGACGTNEDAFKSGLSQDACNGNFPVCNTEVGCILTDTSYTTGTFPGDNQFLVQIAGPATVEIDFYLINPTGSGTSTQITWFEPGCTNTFQTNVPGNVFTGEAENGNGVFSRSQLLSAPGDHLIKYHSDSVTQYLVRAVVIPVAAAN